MIFEPLQKYSVLCSDKGTCCFGALKPGFVKDKIHIPYKILKSGWSLETMKLNLPNIYKKYLNIYFYLKYLQFVFFPQIAPHCQCCHEWKRVNLFGMMLAMHKLKATKKRRHFTICLWPIHAFMMNSAVYKKAGCGKWNEMMGHGC